MHCLPKELVTEIRDSVMNDKEWKKWESQNKIVTDSITKNQSYYRQKYENDQKIEEICMI